MPTRPDNIPERLAAAETNIAGVGKDVEAIVASVEKLSRGVSDGFRDIHERLSAARTTNWPLLGFIATLVGAAGVLYARDSTRFGSDVSQLSNQVSRMDRDLGELANGRARNQSRIDGLDKQMDVIMAAHVTNTAMLSRLDERIRMAIEGKRGVP